MVGSAVIISIPEGKELEEKEEEEEVVEEEEQKRKSKIRRLHDLLWSNIISNTKILIIIIKKELYDDDDYDYDDEMVMMMRRIIHSAKVGIALVVVSLLYLLNPLYNQVGDNAMWAIMTVVVMFEFFAGATLSKGLNRGVGTILGGALGCLAAAFAQHVAAGRPASALIIGFCVFVFGAIATYSRLVHSIIKKRYDYGVMIFILTFNLIVVSGMRADYKKIMGLARERLSNIAMGFAVCIFISLLLFPTWASDELHHSTVLNFHNIANSIQGCMDDYFNNNTHHHHHHNHNHNNTKSDASFSSTCKSILNSKSKHDSLANFAKWEPWHRKFGLNYPWKKYLEIGELLRELAATVLSIKACLQSPRHYEPSSPGVREAIKEACETAGSSIVWTLKELGEGIKKMKKCQIGIVIMPKLKLVRQEIMSAVITPSKQLPPIQNFDALEMSTFLFLIIHILEKVEQLAKQVEQLQQAAGFRTT